jgi:hypothetical protein
MTLANSRLKAIMERVEYAVERRVGSPWTMGHGQLVGQQGKRSNELLASS